MLPRRPEPERRLGVRALRSSACACARKTCACGWLGGKSPMTVGVEAPERERPSTDMEVGAAEAGGVGERRLLREARLAPPLLLLLASLRPAVWTRCRAVELARRTSGGLAVGGDALELAAAAAAGGGVAAVVRGSGAVSGRAMGWPSFGTYTPTKNQPKIKKKIEITRAGTHAI